MKSGIVGFGFALPAAKVGIETLAESIGQAPDLYAGLGIKTRTIATDDENTLTLCARAGHTLFATTKVKKAEVAYCLLGSETPLYSVNPTSTLLAELLEIPETAQMFDMEFACKSGTAALQMVGEILKYKKEKLGLVFAGDVGSGEKGDALYYTAGSGAVALLVGNAETYDALATIEHMTTLNRNRMDFWKAHGSTTPTHAGRWSGEVYAETILASTKHILAETGKTIDEFDHVVFHMPNGKLPARVAKRLGVTPAQLAAGWVVETIGNTYSACVPLGLCNVLSVAKADQDILVVSYGSGAGSDAFWLKTTQHLSAYPRPSVTAAAAALPQITAAELSSLKTR